MFSAPASPARCSASPPANAGSFSAEYVFGDSLSDRGNLAEIYNEGFFYGTPHPLHGFYSGNFPEPTELS